MTAPSSGENVGLKSGKGYDGECRCRIETEGRALDDVDGLCVTDEDDVDEGVDEDEDREIDGDSDGSGLADSWSKKSNEDCGGGFVATGDKTKWVSESLTLAMDPDL